MKVRMKVSISGTHPTIGKLPPSGTVIEVDDGDGLDLCRSGLAEPVAERGKEERAVAVEPVEVRSVEEPSAVSDEPTLPESSAKPLTTATGPARPSAAKR